MPGADEFDDGFQRAHVGAILVNGDDVQLWQNGAEHGPVEERLAGEVVDFAAARDARQRRVEIALVVHREDRAALLDDALAVHHAEVEARPREELREAVKALVVNTHGGSDW